MFMNRFLASFHLLFAVFFAVLGAWLLLDPLALLNWLHATGITLAASELLSHQAGLGLLLAAGVSLFCALRPDARAPLHLLVLFYLAGLVLSHGDVAFGAGAWLWIPVAIYALPLVLRVPVRLPSPGALLKTGQERGEVKWFNPTKGFGFLVTDDGREVFVHFRSVQNGGRRSLRQGQKVRFVIRDTERGEQAEEVFIEDL